MCEKDRDGNKVEDRERLLYVPDGLLHKSICEAIVGNCLEHGTLKKYRLGD